MDDVTHKCLRTNASYNIRVWTSIGHRHSSHDLDNCRTRQAACLTNTIKEQLLLLDMSWRLPRQVKNKLKTL